ncbi:MAG: hypothetical protein AAFU85_28745 [Planctomycetota bacterium]
MGLPGRRTDSNLQRCAQVAAIGAVKAKDQFGQPVVDSVRRLRMRAAMRRVKLDWIRIRLSTLVSVDHTQVLFWVVSR